MTGVNRRHALYLAGAGMAALAGCSEMADDDPADASDESDLPSYATILAEGDRPTYFYGAIDVETMFTIIDDEGAEAGEEPTDPLVGNPVVVALLCSFGLTLLGNSRAGQSGTYSEHDETPDGEATFVYADGVYAFVGEYDRDGFRAALESNGYEPEVDDDPYAVYADPETEEVVGVSDEVYAFSYPNEADPEFDPAAAVERTVATAAGQHDPKHASDDDFEDLLRAGGTDGITLGLYTDDEFHEDDLTDDRADEAAETLEFAFDAFVGAWGVHQQLAVGDDAHATAVVTYADEDRVDVDRLEASLGTEADSIEVSRDGATVTIEAEYAGDIA